MDTSFDIISDLEPGISCRAQIAPVIKEKVNGFSLFVQVDERVDAIRSSSVINSLKDTWYTTH
jgi:hypothetical protein